MKSLAFIAAALLTAAAPAAVVKSVSVRAADGFAGDLTDVTALCTVKAGSDYDAAACSRDVNALLDTRRYEDVSVEAEREGEEVKVVYVIRRKHRFAGDFVVSGNSFWQDSKIRHLANLTPGAHIDSSDVAAAAGRVRDAYRKECFADVKVTAALEPIEGSLGAADVRMTIDEGPRVKISEYGFIGNDSVDSSELRASFGSRPWWDPRGWFSEKPVTSEALAAARKSVERVYRDKGFLDVSVGEPERHDDGKGGLGMVFPVTEGPRYTVGSISVAGAKLFDAADIAAAVKAIAPGDAAGAAALERAAHEVELFYGSRGFADTAVRVDMPPGAKDPSVLDIVFAVTEGVRVEIADVKIRGNDITKDKVIRREISLSPGDPMDENRAEQSRRRLENLRYFERVRFTTEKTGEAAAPGEPEKRNLVFEVAEQPTGNFGIGIGASSVDSVYGMVEVSESNFDIFHPWRFAGGGQKGRLSVMAGPRIQTYEASVTEPWFLDRPLELAVEAYRRERWFDQYDTIRSGASAGISYPVKFWPSQQKAFGRIGFKYSLEFVEMKDVENGLYSFDRHADAGDGEALYKRENHKYGDAFESVLRVYWSDDTRDNFLVPTRGHRVTLFGDVCVGDNEWWKAGFNYGQYLTVVKKWGHVISLRVRGETIDDFSGGVPIYDRLFLGGPRSVRGVEYREIGPRVWRGRRRHEAWGGKTLFALTAEYTVPVAPYVRLAAFTDLGSVGEDAWDPDIGENFCWSAGLGVRLDLPSFPIRLDFAAPIKEPDDGVEKQAFSFTVGYDF